MQYTYLNIKNVPFTPAYDDIIYIDCYLRPLTLYHGGLRSHFQKVLQEII